MRMFLHDHLSDDKAEIANLNYRAFLTVELDDQQASDEFIGTTAPSGPRAPRQRRQPAHRFSQADRRRSPSPRLPRLAPANTAHRAILVAGTAPGREAAAVRRRIQDSVRHVFQQVSDLTVGVVGR
jgi:hypothetical protein